MHEHGAGRRRHSRSRRRGTDASLLCMASAAVACLLVALAILASRPSWDTLWLDLPLGAYLLGGLGGLLTTAAAPGWARRLAPRNPGLVAAATFYRLLAASLLGALGFLLADAAARGIGTPAHAGFGFFAALAAGAFERVVNMALLEGLGILSSREEVS